MIVNWVIQPLERLPVALTGDSPAPARRLALDLRQMMDEDLDDLAGRLRAAAGSAAGDALVAALEDAVLLAGGGRWTRGELAGWTITSWCTAWPITAARPRRWPSFNSSSNAPPTTTPTAAAKAARAPFVELPHGVILWRTGLGPVVCQTPRNAADGSRNR